MQQTWLCILLAILGLPLLGRAQQSAIVRTDHAAVQLLAGVEAVQPGVPFLVGFHMKLQKGWHTYWRNPGDSGMPIEVSWELPEGFVASPWQWPAPEKFVDLPIVNYGYADEVTLLATISPPKNLSPGTSVTLRAGADWLVCQDVCLPESAELTLTLPVREKSRPSAWQETLTRALSTLPQPAPDWKFEAILEHEQLVLRFQPPSSNGSDSRPHEMYFFPEQADLVAHNQPQSVEQQAGQYRLTMQLSPFFQAPPDSLHGVLQLKFGDRKEAFQVAVPIKTRTRNP